MRTPRLPAVDWTDSSVFAGRRNLVSAHVPSHFKRSLPLNLGRATGEVSFIRRNDLEVLATSSFRIVTFSSKLYNWTLCTESKPKTVPSSIGVHYRLWPGISYYTVFRFTSTLDIALEEWCWTEVWVQKVKVKCPVVQALRFCTGRTAHRGSIGIAVLYRH